MGEASVIIRDQGVRRLLRRFADKVKKPGPALAEIGETGMSAIDDVFDSEGGGSWPDLKESTKRQRLKVGKWPGKMLQRSGAAGGLLGSINYKKVSKGADGPKVIWGTNKVYARVHHFGYKKRNIPARPYMVFNRSTIDKFKDILRRYLADVNK